MEKNTEHKISDADETREQLEDKYNILKKNYDSLTKQFDESTSKLKESNKKLRVEIANRKNADEALRQKRASCGDQEDPSRADPFPPALDEGPERSRRERRQSRVHED